MRRYARRLAWPAAVLVALASGCGSGGSTEPVPSGPTVEVVATSQLEGRFLATLALLAVGQSVSPHTLDEIMAGDVPGATGDSVFYARATRWIRDQAATGLSVKGMSVTYPSRAVGSDGAMSRRTLSGAVFLPDPQGATLEAPVLVLAHGTELLKGLVASNGIVSGGYSPDAGGVEGLVAIAAASAGRAMVIMPDYPGMGADAASYHPYCHRTSLAVAGLDMVKAVLGRILVDGGFLPSGLRWNGKVYVTGYSEGGFVAMAVAREWHVAGGAAAHGFSLSCAAPLAGPHSMSGRMVPMISGATAAYGDPYYVPYVLLGYGSVYPDFPRPQDAVRPPYLDAGLVSWMDGTHDSVSVNGQMEQVNGGPVVLRTILDEGWVVANLENPASAVVRTFAANDTAAAPGSAQAWTNTVPLLLIHSEYDDRVPVENSWDAAGWLAAGAAISAHGVSPLDLRLGHGNAAPLALVGSLYWLMNGCAD